MTVEIVKASKNMNVLDSSAKVAYLGLAYGPGILEFMESNPGLVDYVEMPFEQLRHSPDLASIQDTIPLILHCASMSVAGFVPPSQATVDAINVEAERTKTPWIGEHLAFVSADGINEEADRDTTPTNLTYTLCPQLSEETIDRVEENLASLRPRFSVPLILENSPQYFAIPGSTMDMVDFVSKVASRCEVDLLLDLSHLMITSMNTGVDAIKELDRLPLERVVEIHVSGLNLQSGIVWDDHAAPAPPEMFDLLERVMERAHPRALTMEYNWSALPEAILLSHIARTREILARA
jgi:uncharacterized protein (UPF0276 family)